jgi:predicted Zn-dependent peptidase
LEDLLKVNKVIKNKGNLDKPKENRLIKNADEIGEPKEQAEISIIRAGESRPYTENETANLSGRLIYDVLYERLRIDHSLCYGININFWSGKTFSQASINVKTEEKNIELVEKEFNNIVDEIVNEKFNERFNIAKKMYLEQIRSAENLSDNIIQNALWQISKYDGHIVTQKEQIEEVEKVKYDDIVKFIKNTFDPEYIYTEIILPSKR